MNKWERNAMEKAVGPEREVPKSWAELKAENASRCLFYGAVAVVVSWAVMGLIGLIMIKCC